jgi:autotransporter-associated beta strand protein
MNLQINRSFVQPKVYNLRKNLLSLTLAGVGALIGGSVSFGAVAFDADFSTYTLGTLNGQNSWAQIGTTSTASPIQVVAAAGGVPQSIRVTGVASAAQSYRDLPSASRFDPTTGTEAKTFYYVLENFKVIAAMNSTTSTGQGFFALTGTIGGASPTSARLFLRRFGGITTDTTRFDLGLSASGATAVYGTTPLTVGSSYKIVVAYTANPGLANDVVKVYVNPVGLNPATWSHEVTQTATTDPTVSFKSVQITPGVVSNNTKIDLTIGRIIVGDSPSDVLPAPSAPAVSAATGITTSGFTANWGASAGATGYYLDVAENSQFTPLLSGYPKDVGSVTSSLVTGTFAAGTTLYYQVRAYNTAGSSANSTTQTVSIEAGPVVSIPTVTNSTTIGTVTWTSGPGWTPNSPVSTNTATVTFNGALTGSLVATNDSAGNFVLNAITNAISGTGSLTYTGGTLQFVANGSTNPTLTFTNNALVQTFSNSIQVDAELKVNQAGSTATNSILAGTISGAGGINKSGNGYVWIIQSNNTFGGPATVSAGQLSVPNLGIAGSPSSLGTNATISLGSGNSTGTLRWDSAGSETSDKLFVLTGTTGGGTLDIRGTNNILTLDGSINTGANVSTRTFMVTGDGSATLNGLISGNAALRVNGSKTRTVILANTNNSFSGAVTIDGNINGQSTKVQVPAIGNAGSNSPLGTNSTINIGSTVSGSYNFLVWSNTVAETSDKTINLAGAAGGHALINNKGPALLKFTTGLTATGAGAKTLYADQDVSNGVTEFAAAIPDSSLGGATAMNKNGAGTLILSAANTFTGGFTLKGGTLELKNAQSLATGNALTFANNGTGSDRVKVAYAGSGSDLGNLLLQANATIDLGTDTTAQIRFSSATGWTADKILSIAKSSGGGKLYILDTNNVALSQIKSVENPAYEPSLAADGLLSFTAPAPTNTAPAITSGGAFSVPENSTGVTTVTATDAEGNALTYTILGGSDADKFWIDSGTGILTFVSAPNFESPIDVGADNVYNLTVQVADGVLAGTKDIAVTVTNVSDSPTDYKADWLAANGLPAGSSWNSDPNNVGYSLATAYAFGLSPSVNSGAPVALASSPAGSVKIVYLQRNNISGITYVVMSGTDLAAGFNGTVTPQVSANQPVPGKSGYTQYEATYTPPAPATKGFLKVQAFVP